VGTRGNFEPARLSVIDHIIIYIIITSANYYTVHFSSSLYCYGFLTRYNKYKCHIIIVSILSIPYTFIKCDTVHRFFIGLSKQSMYVIRRIIIQDEPSDFPCWFQPEGTSGKPRRRPLLYIILLS